jgi:hypothetical protein
VRRQANSYRAIAYETTAKLTVNVVLSIAAVSALANLLPYRASQEVKLRELQAAVGLTGERVQQVQDKFMYRFDPNQARESMQELTNRIDPLRRQIILQDPQKPVPASQPHPAVKQTLANQTVPGQ